jgi:hypothetical protein
MEQEVMLVGMFNTDDVSILCHKHLDYVLSNSKKLSKQQILGEVMELRDEIDRYC